MQKLSGQILEQQSLLQEGKFVEGGFARVLQQSIKAAEMSKDFGYPNTHVSVLSIGLEADWRQAPIETRILHIFDGIGLDLPANADELRFCLTKADDYFTALNENPELLSEVVAIHDMFFRNLGIKDEFDIEHVFLADYPDGYMGFGNASPTFPYNIKLNRRKLENFSGFQFEEVLTVAHEFVHRYRHSTVLAHTEPNNESPIEEGIAQVIALRFCKEMGLQMTFLGEFIYSIETQVLEKLLADVPSNELINMDMDALSAKLCFPASKLEAIIKRENKILEENAERILREEA